MFPTKRIAVVRTSTEDNLRRDLAQVSEQYGRFRSILVVGHSNSEKLMLTSQCCRPWTTVGQWLNIFGPEFLSLAACEAGRSAAVRDVFGTITSLRQIYASPVTLYKIQTAPLGVIIFMLLANGKLNKEQSEALRIVEYAVYVGQLYRWRRNETGPGLELRGKLWDAIGTALNLGPRDLLEQLFPRTRGPS